MATAFVTVPVIRTRRDLRKALDRLDRIIDAERGSAEGDERTVLTDLIAAYETRHCPIKTGDPIHLLRSLMALHKLNQYRIPEIGSGPVVSAILKGKRALTARMAISLGRRFRVRPEAFLL